jgi:hypothetical protein
MRSGDLLAAPPGHLEPELESALRVALAFDPAARHPSLDPLLERLGAGATPGASPIVGGSP